MAGTAFDRFKSRLENRGLSLRKQWEKRDGTATIQFFLIYAAGSAAHVHHECFVMQWPDGAYQVYLPNPGNDIDADVSAITGVPANG